MRSALPRDFLLWKADAQWCGEIVEDDFGEAA